MHYYVVCRRYDFQHVGGDLEQFIQAQNGKLLSETTILTMFIQLCLGLQEVHAK